MAAVRPSQNRALTAVVAPVVARSGLDLESVTVRTAGRRRQVRIVVDEPGGLSLDRIAQISRDISAALDASDVLGETPYVLEVTSPGVSRPLTLARHWANASGRLVAVRTRGGREFTARVAASDERSVSLVNLTDGSPDERLPLPEIARAVVQVEFSRIAEVDLDDDDTSLDDPSLDDPSADDASTDDPDSDDPDADDPDSDDPDADEPSTDHLDRDGTRATPSPDQE